MSSASICTFSFVDSLDCDKSGLMWSSLIVLILFFQSLALWAQDDPESLLKTPVSAAESGDASPFTPVTFGNGIEFHKPENHFRMNLRFRMQNRADFNLVDSIPADEPRHEFDWAVRRLRLRMNGTVYSPRLQYLLQLSFSRADQDWDNSGSPNVLRDAMILYQLSDSWKIAFGQGKLPGNRQRIISSGDQQFVDRSIVNAQFNIDRDFGLQTQWQTRMRNNIFRWQGAISSGMGRNRSTEPDHRLFYISKLEWLPRGEFSRNGDYFESDLAFEPNWRLSLSATSAFLDGAARNNGTVGPFFTETGARNDPLERRSPWVHYLDALVKWQGHSLYLEWVMRQLDNPIVNAQQAFLVGQGYNFQFGKMLTSQTEMVLRHSAILPDEEVSQFHPTLRQWIVGGNYFLNGHRVKLQANLGRTEGIDTFFRLQMELGI